SREYDLFYRFRGKQKTNYLAQHLGMLLDLCRDLLGHAAPTQNHHAPYVTILVPPPQNRTGRYPDPETPGKSEHNEIDKSQTRNIGPCQVSEREQHCKGADTPE